MKIAIVAGEQSGDELGAALMEAMLEYAVEHDLGSELAFFGVGGAKMQALGLHSLIDQERLAVMGFIEPLKRLPDLLAAKKTLVDACLSERPALFLGIDSPDFNLRIEKTLRLQGIKTAHYVSPSVWAWRRGRIKTIRRAVDLMLTLFPFEAEFYAEHQVQAQCVGHPLADKLPLEPLASGSQEQLRSRLLKAYPRTVDTRYICLMPGSRAGEVELMGELFLAVATHCLAREPELLFMLPAANSPRYAQLHNLLERCPRQTRERICLLEGSAHDALLACDSVLLASGTSSLEAMLLKRPMVVAYKLSRMTYALAKHLVKTPYVALPNLIAQHALVPELIQERASVEALAEELLQLLEVKNTVRQVSAFKALHQDLQRDASAQAARALFKLILTP